MLVEQIHRLEVQNVELASQLQAQPADTAHCESPLNPSAGDVLQGERQERDELGEWLRRLDSAVTLNDMEQCSQALEQSIREQEPLA